MSSTTGPLCDPQEMIERIQSGDPESLERITRCYAARLVSVGHRVCGNPVDADDVVQDALLSAGLHLKDYRGEGSIEGWLVRMVTNACHRIRRGRKNDPMLHSSDVDVFDAADSPEDMASRGEMMDMLGRALERLSPTDRMIVLLAEADGWTGPQIAARLDMKAATVRTRLSRARRSLRIELETRLDGRPR